MQALDADMLLLVAPTPVLRLKLACCCHFLYDTLVPANSANRSRSQTNTVWLRREVHVKLRVNAPVVVRLCWRAGRHLREALIDLRSHRQSGCISDGLVNFNLKGMDVVFKWYSLAGAPARSDILWAHAASMFLTPSHCEVVIRNVDGQQRPRLMNGKRMVVVTFSASERLYNQVLSATSPEFAAQHALPN